MKIIHIVGHSNSGKTTFIHQLLDKLTPMFPQKIGVIKHMGHHNFEMAPGKDTTTHYEHGGYYVAGIDSCKSMVAIHNNEFSELLNLFSDSGIKYAIIEGFKDEGFKKIVKGDLIIENCIMRDPSVDEVINSLDKFDDFYTIQGIVNELKEETDMSRAGAVISFTGIVREFTGEEKTTHMDFFDYQRIDKIMKDIETSVKTDPGILNARFHHNTGRLYAGGDITYLAIISSHTEEAFSAMNDAVKRMKKELSETGMSIEE